jgi:NADPH-dependent 2,4-dienoyl-CoA reductase/sulfur reductase-like enzyme
MHNVVMKQLVKLGVKVITDDFIEGLREDYVGEPKKFTTKKGVEIEADIVVVCVGGHPNVPFPAGEAVDEKSKGLSINEAMICAKLGTDATKPVWAVGDCTIYGGRGIFSHDQIKALSASIAYYEKMGTVEGGPVIYKHKPSDSFPSLVSVGRNGGAITLPFANRMLGKVFKSKDLGLSFMYKKEFDVKI